MIGGLTCRWPATDRVPELAPGEVHVWFFDLDAPLDAALATVVSAPERARCERIALQLPRARGLAARAHVRALLAHYVGEAAADLVFVTQPNGKPRLAGARAPCFNLAHSGAAALLAVSAAGEVGVDIEAIDPRHELDELVARACSDLERARLQAVPAADRLAQVVRWWVRKEALMKASGAGLSVDPRELCVCDLDRDGRLPSGSCSPAGAIGTWLADLDPLVLHAAALAVASTPASLRTCDATKVGPPSR